MRRGRKPIEPERRGDLQAVRAAAVGLLARRDFASAELRAKLAQQGYDPTTIEIAVAELVAGRVLDDRRFADNYVSYHAERGQGPTRISADLRTLGVASETIDAALGCGPSWHALAREVRIRKFGLDLPETWAEKARQARFLQYRGFSSDHIRSALGPDFEPDEQT